VVTADDLTVKDRANKLIKFADDTYLVIPATRASTRTTEIENVELWVRRNNLSFNRSKSREVIFSDVRNKHKVEPPLPLPDITRDTSLKILGVTRLQETCQPLITSEESSATALRHYMPCASYGVMAYVTPAYAYTLSSGL